MILQDAMLQVERKCWRRTALFRRKICIVRTTYRTSRNRKLPSDKHPDGMRLTLHSKIEMRIPLSNSNPADEKKPWRSLDRITVKSLQTGTITGLIWVARTCQTVQKPDKVPSCSESHIFSDSGSIRSRYTLKYTLVCA